MANTTVYIYCEEDGSAPLVTWLDSLPEKVQIKVTAKIQLLGELGFQLRRPHCDHLEGDIRELRARHQNVNYRVLYAFCDRQAVLLSHGCTKESSVPKREIERAAQNLARFRQDRRRHTFKGASI